MGAGKTRKKLNTKATRSSGGGGGSPSATIIINQDDAADMEAGLSTYPVENQWYIIQNLSITGIDQIRTIGVIDQTTGNGIFSKNAEAYVTALSRYVPCTYDVVTNKISCVLRTEGIFYGGATPSFVLDKSSTVGTLSVIENSAGDWLIASTADDFPASKTSCVVGSLSTATAQSFVGDIIIIAASRLSDTKVQVISTSGVIGPYDYIGADGVRIEIHVNIGN